MNKNNNKLKRRKLNQNKRKEEQNLKRRNSQRKSYLTVVCHNHLFKRWIIKLNRIKNSLMIVFLEVKYEK